MIFQYKGDFPQTTSYQETLKGEIKGVTENPYLKCDKQKH